MTKCANFEVMVVEDSLHGVNLSGWLVPEPWVTPELFVQTGALDDAQLFERLGRSAYENTIEKHRSSFVREADFADMASRGFEAVRIPVPWYLFGGFDEYGTKRDACYEHLDNAFSWASNQGIEILVDLASCPASSYTPDGLSLVLHDCERSDRSDRRESEDQARPGSAGHGVQARPGSAGHGVQARPGSAGRRESRANYDRLDRRQLLLDVVRKIARRYGDKRSLMGIEVLDQVQVKKRRAQKRRAVRQRAVRQRAVKSRELSLTQTEGLSLAFLRNYYRDAYEIVRREAGAEPVVVFSDAGEHGAWRGFMSHRRYENIWMDAHLYRHTDEISGSGPSGVRYLASLSADELEQTRKSHLPVMVGEWSSAMPLVGSTVTPEGQLALTRMYTSAQLAAYKECPAWFYQTWKTSTRDAFWDARIALSSFDRDMWS